MNQAQGSVPDQKCRSHKTGLAHNRKRHCKVNLNHVLGDPEVAANIYCKSHNIPNTGTEIYSTDLR